MNAELFVQKVVVIAYVVFFLMLEEARLQDDNKGRKMACTSHAPKTGVKVFPSFWPDRRAFRFNSSLDEIKIKKRERESVPVTCGEVNGGGDAESPESEFTIKREERRPVGCRKFSH